MSMLNTAVPTLRGAHMAAIGLDNVTVLIQCHCLESGTTTPVGSGSRGLRSAHRKERVPALQRVIAVPFPPVHLTPPAYLPQHSVCCTCQVAWVIRPGFAGIGVRSCGRDDAQQARTRCPQIHTW